MDMETAELERLERQMINRWREVAFAEPHTSQVQMERNYDRYLQALDAYMRMSERERRGGYSK